MGEIYTPQFTHLNVEGNPIQRLMHKVSNLQAGFIRMTQQFSSSVFHTVKLYEVTQKSVQAMYKIVERMARIQRKLNILEERSRSRQKRHNNKSKSKKDKQKRLQCKNRLKLKIESQNQEGFSQTENENKNNSKFYQDQQKQQQESLALTEKTVKKKIKKDKDLDRQHSNT